MEHKIISVYGNSYVTTTAINLAARISERNKELKVILVSIDHTTPVMPIVFPHIDNAPSLGALMSSPDDMSDELLYRHLQINSDNVCVLGYAKGENVYSYAAPADYKMDDLFIYLRNIADITIVDCMSNIAAHKFSAKSIINADKVVNLVSADIYGASFYESQKLLLQGAQYGFHTKFMRCLTVGNAFINDTEKFSRLINDNVECITPYSKKAVDVINTGAALSHVDDKKYNATLDTIIENILKEEN